MNQRSISAKQKHRPHLPNDISFEKKISKAIQHKKTLIAKMSSLKSESHQLISYRLSPFWKAKDNVYSDQTATPAKPSKLVSLSDQMIRDYLQSNNISEGNCGRHPHKKAAFEQKQERANLYCHECAIKMVKSNIKVIAITPQTLTMKAIIEQQIAKILDEQAKAKEIIQQHYTELKIKLQGLYTQFQDQKTFNPQTVILGELNPARDLSSRLKEVLGKVEEVKFKFRSEEDKENREKDLNRSSNDRRERKQDNDICDFVLESNRSLQSKSFRLSGKSTRGRENSSYLKRQGPEQGKTMKLR